MNYQEALSILNSFTENNPNLVFDETIFEVGFEEGAKSEMRIKISISQNTDEKLLIKKYSIAKTFSYTNEKGKKSDYKIAIVKSNEIVAHAVRMGTQGKHVDLVGYGTYGWGFILNGAPVALSNWHVFCPHGNSTQLGTRVQLENQTIASLSFFEPMSNGGQNKWDMALATFDNIADMQAAFTPCQTGIIRPYPRVIQSDKLDIGTPAYKVGARPPVCREGTFVGVSNIRVKYHDNVVRNFIGQLKFSKMSDPGDSGSVIVNSTSNKVIGLNFAGNDNDTFANPIFIYDKINYVGTKFISDDFELAVYETKKENTEDNKSLKDGTFPSDSGVPPSLGGVTGKFSIVIITNGEGMTKHGLKLVIDRIIGSYGSAWIKVSYHIDTMLGQVNSEGWFNASAPTFLYIND